MYFLLFPSLNSFVSLPGENKKPNIMRKKTASKLTGNELFYESKNGDFLILIS